MFDTELIRSDFPYNKEFAFLDSAASAQKPRIVIDGIARFYENEYANIHRGIYQLSQIATEKFEDSRRKIAKYINADNREIIFTRNATEGINLVAQAFGMANVKQGDSIMISEAEHHANIVPWQVLCKKNGTNLVVSPINTAGELDLQKFEQNLQKYKPKIVAINQMSNLLGTWNDAGQIAELAHFHGAMVLIDACQSIVHSKIDVKKIDCDFLVFSAHKLYGPSGIGVLYGKYDILEQMEPYQFGGEMVDIVSFENTTFQLPPIRFEAGTPAIADVVGFGYTMDYLKNFDWQGYQNYEKNLLKFAMEEMKKIGRFSIVTGADNKTSLFSFIHDTAHPSDIGEILDNCSVAIRTGNHCAQPLLKKLGLSATARLSLGIYNNQNDIEKFLNGLIKINKLF